MESVQKFFKKKSHQFHYSPVPINNISLEVDPLKQSHLPPKKKKDKIIIKAKDKGIENA